MPVKRLNKREMLAALAPLLEYPTEHYKEVLEDSCTALKERCPEACATLLKFKKEIDCLSKEELEEIYTRTFDVAPVSSPYISVHLYGDENFDRGNLMATLASKFEERGFKNNTELPDHLAVLLRFSEYLTDEELDELVEHCLREPLENMLKALKGTKSPNLFYFPILSVRELIDAGHF